MRIYFNLVRVEQSFFFCSIKQWTCKASVSVLSTIGDVAKSATSGSVSTMKGVIDVGNVTPISASMVGVACAAGSVAEACASTVSSKSVVESVQDVSMEIARIDAKHAKNP